MAATSAPTRNDDESRSSAQEIFVTMLSSAHEPLNWGASSSGTSEKKKNARVHWSESETWALIRLWQDNLAELRRHRRNSGVYETIRVGLERLSIVKTRKQVSDKIDNLNQTYRAKKKSLTTGSGKVSWPFYYDLHSFLGSLPVNDPSLVNDSLPADVVEEPGDSPHEGPDDDNEVVDLKEEPLEERPKKKRKSSMKQGDILMLFIEEQRKQRKELSEARERAHQDRQRQFSIMEESNQLQRDFLDFMRSRKEK
ncbi:uncharacterized protein LOC121838536 [Ixodes scapularis]|uniref:uncharacterized protein LOC115316914 n=1 Tax=Ixodes scapularis TaxID=6945 RepID=UPI0011618C4F|nr:uncharacterized protein LOC115316914 [Ixodes scapularis]XP_040062507.1 uncharacterized protein LOC120837321 [Ixodes scapularis]XP_042150776.1 uncharacterized protein LOC121838536 [Ixodes scapularis]